MTKGGFGGLCCQHLQQDTLPSPFPSWHKPALNLCPMHHFRTCTTLMSSVARRRSTTAFVRSLRSYAFLIFVPGSAGLHSSGPNKPLPHCLTCRGSSLTLPLADLKMTSRVCGGLITTVSRSIVSEDRLHPSHIAHVEDPSGWSGRRHAARSYGSIVLHRGAPKRSPMGLKTSHMWNRHH